MKKILVIDNSLVILRLMSSLLAKNGHEVLTASGGLAALEILKDFTPDIIFVDLIMPDIPGDKLCRMMRRRLQLKNAFIVVITAVAAEESLEYEAFGADACIAKGPFGKMSENILRLIERAGRESSPVHEIIGLEDVYARGIVKELSSVRKHLETLISSISDGILEITADGTIIYANPFAAFLIGEPEDSLLATLIHDWFQKADRDCLMELIGGSARNEPERPDPLSFVLPNEREISLTILPIRDAENKKIVLLNDVTESSRSRRLQQKAQMDMQIQIEKRTAELARLEKALKTETRERERLQAELRKHEERKKP